ncbi:MAG TPA: hypothetical protein VMB50_23330 [Myxococcales bacterium]|nr:hypothetical protein [Myxococcales bacterium]
MASGRTSNGAAGRLWFMAFLAVIMGCTLAFLLDPARGPRSGFLYAVAWALGCLLFPAWAGARIARSAFDDLRKGRQLLVVPPSKVRSLALGPAELYGRVRALTPSPSPYSGDPCVYCRWTWAEGLSRRPIVGTIEGRLVSNPEFWLDDGTGSVRVDMTSVSPTDVGLDAVSFHDNDALLPEGAPVFVAGVAQRRVRSAGEPSLDGRPSRPEEIVIGPGEGMPLTISRHPRREAAGDRATDYWWRAIGGIGLVAASAIGLAVLAARLMA